MDQDNPEFKKLAFTAPGPKNAFAPLKRRDYMDKKGYVLENENTTGNSGNCKC